MNEHLLKQFWHVVSNRHIEEGMDKLRIVSLRLINQYALLISLIFIIDAIRNLSFGRPINFVVLFTVGCLLFLLSWFTKLHLNVKMATSALIMVTLVVFYFCSTAGFHNGIAPYYFSILFAALFIFNERHRHYNIFVFLWIFVLFYVVHLFDLEMFSSLWRSQVCFHENPQATLMQSVLLLVVNGYFIMLKNTELQKLYRQVLHADIQPFQLNVKSKSATISLSVEDIVKLAQTDDPAFIVAFQQVFPDFYANLYRQNTGMTQEEFKFCALLKLGFTTKEIANYNHLAIRTVQTKKSRLRKSFNIPRKEDLYMWIAQF
ncbi:diguanylate cyclase [Sphingobacterium sp. DN00404]|uniref:Diguanylate cyclase n=1 Tax=Sphingobacterium micropteri TaxID=2763501 RepID=A0ABR7YM23_9SPHI|nr:diguanylate cyclase [Sphingobacterium micropteri]MBD1432223.1 diguanylate cyclase [Sphingobacterium micropteri]